jgi:hypothetical protein
MSNLISRRFLPPLFKTKIKENAAILTWKQNKRRKLLYKGIV